MSRLAKRNEEMESKLKQWGWTAAPGGGGAPVAAAGYPPGVAGGGGGGPSWNMVYSGGGAERPPAELSASRANISRVGGRAPTTMAGGGT